MLKKEIEKALNTHLNEEFFSANLYLSISAYFSSIDLPGFAHWMKIQYEEETFHGMKFLDFIDIRGGRVKIEGIKKPEFEWKSPLDAFEEAFKHEQYISSRINDLVDLALKERDHALNNFLQWFVSEQMEEEATTNGIFQKLKKMKDSATSLLMLDQELAGRVFTPPAK